MDPETLIATAKAIAQILHRQRAKMTATEALELDHWEARLENAHLANRVIAAKAIVALLATFLGRIR